MHDYEKARFRNLKEISILLSNIQKRVDFWLKNKDVFTSVPQDPYHFSK